MSPQSDDVQVASSPASPVGLAEGPKVKSKSGFAGFSWPQLFGGTFVLGAAVWGAWLTREVADLQNQRIVSVSLAAMANDFVMAEARSGVSPEQAEVDTKHYMDTLHAALKERAANGETILVSEAVVSGSVPDVTAEVREAVGKAITANPAPRAQAAAGVPSPVTGQQAIAPVIQPGPQMPAFPQGEANAGSGR